MAPPGPTLSGASRMDRRTASVGATVVSPDATGPPVGSTVASEGAATLSAVAPAVAGAGGVPVSASAVAAGAEAGTAVSPAVSVAANAVPIGSIVVSAGSTAE